MPCYGVVTAALSGKGSASIDAPSPLPPHFLRNIVFMNLFRGTISLDFSRDAVPKDSIAVITLQSAGGCVSFTYRGGDGKADRHIILLLIGNELLPGYVFYTFFTF